jgi:hypothetical protein
MSRVRCGGIESPITVEIMVASALRFFSGSDYVSICSIFKLGKSTFFQVPQRFMERFLGIFKYTIKFPQTAQEKAKVSTEFRELTALPISGCLGALDGCHFPIKSLAKMKLRLFALSNRF